MSNRRAPIVYKGRSLGTVALVGAQILIGIIHTLSGIALLSSEIAAGSQVSLAYDVYTLVFGLLTLLFAVYFWQGKKLGWIGTFAVSLFVIIVDTLTLLGFPSIPGIPRFAAATEPVYCLLVIVYLILPHVRRRFGFR